MSDHSRIEWTDATWNPVTGCTKVSPGCRNCYARRFAERFRGVPGHPFEQGFDLRLWPDRRTLPLSWKRPRRVFVNSMSDLFHSEVPTRFIQQVFVTMRRCPQHQFQLLTKRAERLASVGARISWPGNVWIGVSIENQQYAARAELLRQIPATIRFLSLEPLIGPVHTLPLKGIHWVIVGGESGPGARPMRREWVTDIQAQCLRARVPFFFKQWGGLRKRASGRLLHGRTYDEMPRMEAAV